MKVLFIASGNANTSNGMTSIVYNQGKSLEKEKVHVDYYGIKGKGFKGYLSNISIIRKEIKKNKYDIVHAHYSMTGYATSLACFGLKIPVIVSLMGSDVNAKPFQMLVTKLFSIFLWKCIIVKSEDMKTNLGNKSAIIIPNGVDLEEFQLGNQKEYKKKVDFDINKKQIIWVSNPERYAKNYALAKDAFDSLSLNDVELKVINGVPHNKIKDYMLAADMLLLSSRWEGSPNVIKEAMALNLPIVTTDVGDVKTIIQNTNGCYIVSQDAQEIASAIKKCLRFEKKTNGRDKIKHLDTKIIAKRLIQIYNEAK